MRDGRPTGIKRWDLYGRLPAGLTETTFVGVLFSVSGALLMAYLLLGELAAYQTPTISSTMHLRNAAHSDEILLINFNLTLHHVACEFVRLDSIDVFGAKTIVDDDQVQMFDVLAHGSRVESDDPEAAEVWVPAYKKYVRPPAGPTTWHQYKHITESLNHKIGGAGEHEILPADHPAVLRLANEPAEAHFSSELSVDELNGFIETHDIVLTDFYAPWCIWCQRFAPVFEHAAEIVSKKPYGHIVKFAKIDCTTPENGPLCAAAHIRAYPTVYVYRSGRTEMHRRFTGARTSAALVDFIEGLPDRAELDVYESDAMMEHPPPAPLMRANDMGAVMPLLMFLTSGNRNIAGHRNPIMIAGGNGRPSLVIRFGPAAREAGGIRFITPPPAAVVIEAKPVPGGNVGNTGYPAAAGAAGTAGSHEARAEALAMGMQYRRRLLATPQPPFVASKCVYWRQSSGCNPDGKREPTQDLGCDVAVPAGASGYCECEKTFVKFDCKHASLTCASVCAAGHKESLGSRSGVQGNPSTSDDAAKMAKLNADIAAKKAAKQAAATPPPSKAKEIPEEPEEQAKDGICVGWRQTGGCDPNGKREKAYDKKCFEAVPEGASGYCLCANSIRVKYDCSHLGVICQDECYEAVESEAMRREELTPLNNEERDFAKQMEEEAKADAKDHEFCVGWVETADCDPHGKPASKQVLGCSHIVHSGHSGYCNCGFELKVHVSCNHATFVCKERCRRERDDIAAMANDDSAGFMAGDKAWADEQWKEWVHREHVHSPDDGCRLQGSVNSLNVPGSLRLEIGSAWHDIPHETLNLSHTVHGFSFGKVALAMSELLEKEKLVDVWQMEGVNNVNGLATEVFTSSLQRGSHEHFLRVVRTELSLAKDSEGAQARHPHHYYQYQVRERARERKKWDECATSSPQCVQCGSFISLPLLLLFSLRSHSRTSRTSLKLGAATRSTAATPRGCRTCASLGRSTRSRSP